VIDWVDSEIMRAIVSFARISGAFLLLPGVSSVRVPQQVRIVFVLALTAALMPLMPPAVILDSSRNGLGLVRLLFSETVTGALIGIGARYYVLSVSFMMNAASSSIGISSQFGPSVMDNDMEPALASIVSSATILALFALDFHHHAIRALVESFRLVPVGTLPNVGAVAENLVTYIADCFLVVFRLGSPFLAYALVVNTFIALLNKLVPNLPVYFVATPAVLLGAVLLIYFLIPAIISLAAQGYFEMPL
jgi:flagellar biosynthesis protein FliR